MFVKTFSAHGEFSALGDATEWVRSRGYSLGIMCGNEPIAFKKGYWNIQKWRNLSADDRFNIDGVVTSDDFRDGDVTIKITNFKE